MKWMFAVPAQVDAKHDVDLVAAGKGKGAQVGWFGSPADPRALADFVWHPICPAGWIMSLRLSDMDGDGDLDVVTTDRKGQMRGCRWLENPGPGAAQREQWQNHSIGGTGEQVMFMTIADLDQDGMADVLVAAKPAKVLFLKRLDIAGKSWKTHTIAFPDNTGTAKAVEMGDIDRDGRQDLVFSCEHAAQGKSGVMWLSYRQEPTDPVWEAHEISGAPGIKYDRLELIDLDGDADLDVLTCEEREGKRGLGVFWYENPMDDP